MDLDFWGRMLWEFINASGHSGMQLQALGNFGGFLMSERQWGSSLLPLRTRGYLDQRHPWSICFQERKGGREGGRGREMGREGRSGLGAAAWRAMWTLLLCNVHPRGLNQHPPTPPPPGAPTLPRPFAFASHEIKQGHPFPEFRVRSRH